MWNNVCINDVDQNESHYKCVICSKKHVVPENGFGVNQNMAEILKFNAHLDDKTKSLHKIIDDFDKIVTELSLMCKNPENFIFDYVSATR